MEKYVSVGMVLLSLLLTSVGSVPTAQAREAFNVAFTTTQIFSVDSAQILWSTSEDATCNVRYSRSADLSGYLVKEGVSYIPTQNSGGDGRTQFVGVLAQLHRNTPYYFSIDCVSKSDQNVRASSVTLSFLTSVGYFDLPDLTVSSVSFDPTPVLGQLYTGALNVVVKNIGNESTKTKGGIEVAVSAVNGNTGGTHPLGCDVCDPVSGIGKVSTSDLAVGESRTVSFRLVNNPFNFGTFNVRASIDHVSNRSSGDIAEMDEGNNLLTKDFKISPLAQTTAKTAVQESATTDAAVEGTAEPAAEEVAWYIRLWRFIWRF